MTAFNKDDPAQVKQLSDLLSRREAELRAVLRAINNFAENPATVENGDVVDFEDLATEEVRATLDDLQASRAASELKQIVSARQRLADQSYGICLDCAKSIELRRLMALPAAALCIDCQSRREATALTGR